MLVLRRNVGEAIRIGNAEVTILQVQDKSVRLKIDAPSDVKVMRSELLNRTDKIPKCHNNGDEPLEY